MPRRNQRRLRRDDVPPKTPPTSRTTSIPTRCSGSARPQPHLEREADRRRRYADIQQDPLERRGLLHQAARNTTNNVFNEQQTYYWAQTLKTAVDLWGREPNDFGHYPVDASRAVNVEIVVNGDGDNGGCLEAGRGVITAISARRARAAGSRLQLPVHRARRLPFNSAGNTTARSSSAPSTPAPTRSSLTRWGTLSAGSMAAGRARGTNLGVPERGPPMVIAALLGKQHFGALEYDESEYVTTGGDGQWSHSVTDTAAEVLRAGLRRDGDHISWRGRTCRRCGD